MRGAVRIGGLLAAATLPAGPAAADLSITGFFSQQAQVREGGGGEDDDVTLRSTTDLGLSVRDTDGRTTWTFAPGLRGLLSTDPDQSGRLTPRFNGSLATGDARTSLSAALAVLPEFTDETQFEDTGRVERDVLQITVTGRLGLSHRLGALDTVSLGVSARTREFLGDPETLSPSRSFGLDGSWRRALSALSSGSVSPGLRWFASDARNGADGVTFSLPLGFETRLDPRVSLSASLGPSLTRSRRPGQSETTDAGVVGGVTAIVLDGPLRWSLGFNQSVDQNSDGVLQNVSSLRGGVSWQVNSVSRLALDGSIGLQTGLGDEDEDEDDRLDDDDRRRDGGGGGDRRTLSVGPRYSHRLTEAWSADISYRFRLSDDDGGAETTNTVFVGVSRGLDLLP